MLSSGALGFGQDPAGLEGGSDSISLSGLLEAELGIVSADTPEQDVVLATGEIGLTTRISNEVSAEIVFLWEEDDTPEVVIDQGYITVAPQKQWNVKVGKRYVPFGVFETLLVSDPLTLELGETNQSCLSFQYNSGMVDIELAVFNGDLTIDGGDETLQGIALGCAVEPIEDLVLGISYLSNIADSEGLENEVSIPGDVTEPPAGISVFARHDFNDFSVLFEYIMAGGFDAADLDHDGNGDGDTPLALNLEFGYAVNDEFNIALRYSMTSEFLDMPLSQIGAAVNYSLYENTFLSAEIMSNTYDEDFTGIDEGNTVITVQLSVEF